MSSSTEKIPENIYIKDFRKLTVYQKSLQLCDEIYKIVRTFPDFEKYAMVSQLIRSCTSISANIAEGNSQIFIKKEISFLNTALGSASEVKCWIEIAQRQKYISQETCERLEGLVQEIVKLIIGMIKRFRKAMG